MRHNDMLSCSRLNNSSDDWMPASLACLGYSVVSSRSYLDGVCIGFVIANSDVLEGVACVAASEWMLLFLLQQETVFIHGHLHLL